MNRTRMQGVKANLKPSPLVTHKVNKSVKVNRTDLTLESPVDGLYPYNNRLFDICTDSSIIAMSLVDKVDPFLEAFPISNSSTWKHSQAYLTYMSGQGAATGTMGNGTVGDACEDPECIEAGFVRCEVEGFGRFRRCGFVRDLRNRELRYCEIEPIYDIGGNRIEDDFEYDMVRISSALLQDLNNLFFTADSANAGEFDGILQWVVNGFTDPVTGTPHPEMDSYVVDWNLNDVCDFDNGIANDITVNGNVIPAAGLADFSLIDLIRDYVMRVSQRIRMSSLSGNYTFIGAADPNLIQCLMDCWVCYRVCSCDVTLMDSFEARAFSEELREQLTDFGAIRFRFDGQTVILYPWLWDGLYNAANDSYSLFLTVPRVGNYNVWDFEFLDVSHLKNMPEPEYQEIVVTDNNRWAHWSKQDHMCKQTFTEFSPRLRTCAPWVSMIVNNISCSGNIFGRISKSVLDPAYLGGATLEAAPQFN